MSDKVEFNQTSILRLLSVFCLGISDLCLINNRWRYFFLFFLLMVSIELFRSKLYKVFFLLMVSIELFRSKLYKVLLHDHENTVRIQKLEALKEHTANLASIKNKSK